MMKKIFLTAVLIAFTLPMSAQFLQFGIKGGLNYNENGNLESIGDSFSRKSNEEVGYHLGLFTQINLPIIYLRPELLYTSTKSSYVHDDTKSDMNINKFDVPILVGIKVLKYGRAFIGPAFQYITDVNFSAKDVKNISYDDFTMGLQAGLGAQLGKFGADVRWERGLTDSEAEFIQRNTPDGAFKVDTRANQFIFSVSYRFN